MINNNNNDNNNNIGGNENTRNTPVPRQMGANGWQRWSMWSSCCTQNSNTEFQTRKRVCNPQGKIISSGRKFSVIFVG